MILEGAYQNGNASPLVRQITNEQRINPFKVFKASQIRVNDYLVVEKRRLGMYVGEGVREQLLKDERSVFIDFDLPELQNRAQRLGFILKDLLQEVS